MASIIQLKTGTGSAEPTSLAQGEVAINIDNGLFYFGSGSGEDVKSLESFTNITSSGNISSSGTVQGLTGSFHALVGDTSQATSLEVEGPITGSSISASGNIYGDDLIATGELFTTGTGVNKIEGILTLGSATIPAGGNNLRVEGTSTFTSHITASGNISSSGTIIANKFEVDNNTGLVGKNVAGADRTLITLDNSNILKIKGNDSEGSSNVITMAAGGDVTMPADLTVAGTLTAQEFHTEFVSASIIFTSGSTQFGNSADDIHTFSGSINIKDEGHITASGNISASGIITADSIWLPGGNTITWGEDQVISGNENNITIDGDDKVKLVANSTIEVGIASNDPKLWIDTSEGHITASGNISASGQVYSDNIETFHGSARITSLAVNNYSGPNLQGIMKHEWTRTLAETVNDNNTIQINRQDVRTGIIIPYAFKITGFTMFYGVNKNGTQTIPQGALFALSQSQMDLNDNGATADTNTVTAICTGLGQGAKGYNTHLCTGSCDVDMPAGSSIYYRVKPTTTVDGTTMDMNYTIQWKRIKE